MNKRKHYLVTIITKEKKESMIVPADNKQQAIEMVDDVISKCSLFNYPKGTYKIVAKRKIINE